MAAILKFILKKMSKKRTPQVGGEIKISILEKPVEIFRDKWGIPHIYAKNETDLMKAVGFTHAQERLWQMELLRRTATGTLSEIFGELSLDTDRAIRIFGFRRLAEKDWENLSTELQSYIHAYCDGINAFLHHPSSKMPIEFSLIKHKPEPWTNIDTLSFARLMMFQLNGQFQPKLILGKLSKMMDWEKIKQLFPEYSDINPSVLKAVEEFVFDTQGILKAVDGPFFKRNGASNSWAVTGSLTETGMPIQCNDPHLAPSVPSIWYYCHLVGGKINVTGVTVPAAPLVLIGHNAAISWGFTVANVDSEDFFIEKFNPNNPEEYEFQEHWKKAETISEPIMVKGANSPHIEKVIITHHGPLVSEAVNVKDTKLTLCSIALQPGTSLEGFYRLNLASNWHEFTAAVKLVSSVNQNMTYADIEGNIGSYICGRIPIRKNGEGRIPSPGWTGEFDWEGEIPFEEKPHCLNPSDGFVVTANNRPIIPDNYPYYLSHIFDPGYRAHRIRDLLNSKTKISIEDCKTIHMDLYSLCGMEFIQKLEFYSTDNPEAVQALELLRNWDGILTTETIGGTIYEVSQLTFFKKLLSAHLSEADFLSFMGHGFHPVLKASSELFHGTGHVLCQVLEKKDSWWIKEVGGIERWITDSLVDTIHWLKENIGDNPKEWQWGKINKMVYPHAMAMQKPLDKVFNVGPRAIGGDKNTVCQIGSPVGDFSQKIWAPSYRQIVNLADFSTSVIIFSPGESGHLGSPHYDDLFDLWMEGKYIPMLWTREQVEAQQETKLTLI